MSTEEPEPKPESQKPEELIQEMRLLSIGQIRKELESLYENDKFVYEVVSHFVTRAKAQ